MEKHALYHMTWKEIEEIFKNDPVVIIPMGSTEQQGIHSLTGDYLAAFYRTAGNTFFNRRLSGC